MKSISRSSRLVGAGLLLAAAAFPIAAASAQSAAPDIVLAPVRANQSLTMNALLGFVNSEPVFVHDLLRPIDGQLRALAKSSRNLTAFKEAARPLIESQMRGYISNILILSSAKAALSEEDKANLDPYMNKQRIDLLSKYGGSRALADQALKAEGSSVDKFLADKRRGIIVQLYLQKQLYPKIVITRDMVLDEYQHTPKAWQQEPEVELFTITLPVSRYLPHSPGLNGQIGEVIANPTLEQMKAAQAQALNTANEIVDKLNKGADFARLVEDYSSKDTAANYGGRTPHLKRGSLVNRTEEDYVFSLPAGTIGKPLLLDADDWQKASVAVIKIGEKKEARTVSFTEAQEKIWKKLHDQQYDQLSAEYMQNLYKGAAIERVDRMADVVVDVAVARYATQ